METTQSNKKTKKNLTSYWAVELDTSIFQECDEIKQFLITNPNIVQLKAIHSTLLYVGKKENTNESVFVPLENKECTLEIEGYGYSDDAALIDFPIS